MRWVFDTNVLISALLIADSIPSRALIRAEGTGKVMYSAPIMEELRTVLSRSKFSAYINDDEIAGFLARIKQNWEEIHIIQTVVACRDPKDDKFLELAINGRADALVTGDNDLLVLHPYRKVSIVTPTDFLKRLGG